MKQNPSYLLREIENVPYLLPYGQMIADRKRGMKINSTGIYLWKLLEQDISMNELLSLSAAYYEVPDNELSEFQSDITQFIKQLIAYGIVLDTNDLFPSSEVKWYLSIAGLTLSLSGPTDAFPAQFNAFRIDAPQRVHLHIEIQIGMPTHSPNGKVVLRNQELVVLEQEEQYILLFPKSPTLAEIHLKKDASYALCYCIPPYNEHLHNELFHALRLVYLYLAGQHQMVALHSSSILYQDKAWLFSAPSGTGKSTHANLWRDLYNTPILNGDLNLLAIKNNIPVIHGIPWCGTSKLFDTQTHPLGGIILLKQAPTDTIEELPLDQRILLVQQRLISPCWTPKQFDTNLSVIQKIAAHIMICRLHCTKENSACELMKTHIDNT